MLFYPIPNSSSTLLDREKTIHIWRPDRDVIAEDVLAESGRAIDRRGWTSSHVWLDGSLSFVGDYAGGYLATVDRELAEDSEELTPLATGLVPNGSGEGGRL